MNINVRNHGRAQRHALPRVAASPEGSHAAATNDGQDVWLSTARALLRIRTAADAASLLQRAARSMGATIVPAREFHSGAIRTDLNLGAGAPLFAVPGPTGVPGPRLEEILPALTEDARHAVDLIRRKAQLEEESTRDPLTGLANRRVLDRVIARAKDGTIIAVDLDGFKPINDTLGHAAGDGVLVSFGQLLLEQVRANDIACRYGGDEFVIIARSTTFEALAMIARIREQWAMLASDVTFSAGVAPITMRGGIEAMCDADAALYLAKRCGRNRTELAPASTATSGSRRSSDGPDAAHA